MLPYSYIVFSFTSHKPKKSLAQLSVELNKIFTQEKLSTKKDI